MKRFFLAMFIPLYFSSHAQAEVQSQQGYRCITIQTFLWPMKNPSGLDVVHTVRVVMESYSTDDYQAKISAAQAAWKTCRQTLGIRFDEDWSALGADRAPFPPDEFGQPRPPKICETIYKRPDLYECNHVARQADQTADPFVLIENVILK